MSYTHANAMEFPGLRARNRGRNEAARPVRISLTHDTWKSLWKDVVRSLKSYGYAPSTLLFYRQIIRSFSRSIDKPPSQITPGDIHDYLRSAAGKPFTWHWTAMNISVLRTVFDKLSGLNALTRQKGPRRSKPLPEYLNRPDIARLLAAAGNLRDQLVIALLYGCGLKTSELQRIMWNDIDPEAGTLQLTSCYSGKIRILRLPANLQSILRLGKSQCPANQFVIPGARPDQPVSTRSIQRIITLAAKKLGLGIPVTPMTLRHSFAVHYLEDGGNIRELQTALDHQTLEATMRYDAVTPEPVTPPTSIQIDPAWETLATPPFPLTESPTRFVHMLKTRLKDRFLSLRIFWRSS